MPEYTPKHANTDSLKEAEKLYEEKKAEIRKRRRSGKLHFIQQDENERESVPLKEEPIVQQEVETAPPEPYGSTIEQTYVLSQSKAVSQGVFAKYRKPIIAAGCFLLVVGLVCAVQGTLHKKGADNTTEAEVYVPKNPMPSNLRQEWLKNKEINSDYIGQIIFDSGLIDLKVVQAGDVYQEDGTLYEFYTQDGVRVTDPAGFSGNDVYIWSDWQTHKYDGHGSDGAVFLDYRNDLISDPNLIIFGHHIARDFDPSGDKEFTPLDLLLEQENYEGNKTLKLILDNEIRTYIVARIFTIDAYSQEESQILRTDFTKDLSGIDDPEFFSNYFGFVKTVELYSTGIELHPNDRTLTLITCIQHQPQYRQVIICVETGAEEYDG